MTFALALTQAPQHSYYNGANTATARQYYLRPTQHTPSGPRIAAGTAGMVAGEFRTLWASATDNIFKVENESNGYLYNGLDWTPRAIWHAPTQQIIIGTRRASYKYIAYSDVTGDWREMAMHPDMGRWTEGTAHYYGMIAQDGAGQIYLGQTLSPMFRLEPEDEVWARIADHLVTNGSNGSMLAWSSAANALYKYSGNAQRFLRYDPGTDAWTLLASSIGNGEHALMEYNPAADRFLIVGGTGTSSRATLVTPAGAKIQVTDAPQPSSMSSGSWIAYHPAGCWLFKGWPETGDKRLYACWPNADKTDVVWQDLGVAPDNGLTYSTAAVDYDRGMIYIVSTTGLHAYKLPDVTDPSAGSYIDAQEAGADTAAIAGAVLVAGSLSVTESGADAFSSSGAVTIAGTLAATEQGADTASIVGGNILAGYMAAQEAGSDTAAASGAVIVSGLAAASEAGADGFAASGSIGATDVIGNFAALESGADTISVSGVVLVSGALAATETGSDTMQTTTGEGYPSSVTITVPSGRTITLRPR